MPWYNAVTGEHVQSPSDYINKRDELVYKPSIYAKEELPTWSEVYEEFYLDKQYSYDPNNINDNNNLDLYWKIPHKKYLIAVVCNQFNKMLYEDNLKDNIINEINKHLSDNIIGLQFIIHPIEPNIIFMIDDIPAIYTIPMPNGKNNPFIIYNHSRIDVNNIISMKFNAVIQIKNNGLDEVVRYTTEDEFNIIMEIMIKPFKDYFSGNIGWKDQNGNLIEEDISCRNCSGAGYCTT